MQYVICNVKLIQHARISLDKNRFCKMRNVKILACKETAYTLTRVTGASHVTSNRIICILKITQQCDTKIDS